MPSKPVAQSIKAAVAAVVVLALAMPPASAQTPDLRMSDLVNQGSDCAQRELRNRGFVRKGGWQSGNAAYSMWWNAGTRQCVQGVVSDGRIQSLNPIVEGNCT